MKALNSQQIILKDGWTLASRFRYVPFFDLNAEDQRLVRGGSVYRLVGHAREDRWLYPVRKDGVLTRQARRVRLNDLERPHRMTRLLEPAAADRYLRRVNSGPWESWKYSGKRELKLSKGYCQVERLPTLRRKMLAAFDADRSQATELGIAWIPPGAYDKSHFHDVDVIVLALSKRNETGKLAFKRDGNWVDIDYDVGEAVLIPKYVEHRVMPTSIDRYTAAISILD